MRCYIINEYSIYFWFIVEYHARFKCEFTDVRSDNAQFYSTTNSNPSFNSNRYAIIIMSGYANVLSRERAVSFMK